MQLGHDPDDTISNESDAPKLTDLVLGRLSRREALRGIAASSAFGLFSAPVVSAVAEAATPSAAGAVSSLKFPEIKHIEATAADITVARGYKAQVLIRWGDAVMKDAPAFDPNKQSAASAGAPVRRRMRLPRLHAAAHRLAQFRPRRALFQP